MEISIDKPIRIILGQTLLIPGNLIDPREVANQPFACGHLNEKLEYEMFEFYTMVMRKLLMQIRMAFL